jgi:hypothetical protein
MTTYTPEQKIMIDALQVQRNKLAQELATIDKVIKKVKIGDTIASNSDTAAIQQPFQANSAKANYVFPVDSDIKVQILSVMDMRKRPLKTKELQTEFDKYSRNRYSIRETLRGMQKSGIVWLLKLKGTTRGFLWVKRDWVDPTTNLLFDEYKFQGFDMLYKPDNIEYE